MGEFLNKYIYILSYTMTQQNINVGTNPNDGTGDSVRTGATKVNANFTELYPITTGTATDAGSLTGAEIVPMNRSSGLLQKSLTNIGNWIVNLYQGFTQSGTGAVARTVQSKLSDVISVKDFGAVGNGITDDTVAIQAFLSALTSGKAGYIPSGIYLYSSPLVLPAAFSSIQGAGKYSSVFVYTGANTTNNLLTVIGTSPTIIKGPATMGGFGLRSNTVMTGGSALFIKWAGHITTKDVAMGAQYDVAHNLWNGIEYFSTDFQIIDDFEIQVQNEGFRVSGGGAGNPGPQYDLWASNGKICLSTVGIHIGGGWDNAYFDKIIATTNGTNVLIDNAIQTFKNQEIGFGPQFVADQAQTGDNYHINDTLANQTNYGQIIIQGPVTGCKTGHGINIQNWPSCFINVASPYIANNSQNGIYIQDSSAKVLISSYTNIVNNSGFGIAGAFANTPIVAPCTFSGNTSGSLNTNIVNNFAPVSGLISGSSLSVTGTVAGAAGNFTAQSSITTSGSTRSLLITDTGINGSNISLVGNGVTTPSKHVRVNNGVFQIINDAYSSIIASIDDSGNLVTLGSLTANATNSALISNDTSGTNKSFVYFKNNGTIAWDWSNASTSNNFALDRYVSGTYTDSPITVSNSTGVVSMPDGLTVSGGTVLLPANVGVGSANPSTDGGLLVVRKDQNTDSIFKVYNNNTGASTSARIDLTTGTANSFVTIRTADNAAAPYWQIAAGTAIQNMYYSGPNHQFQNTAGANQFRVVSTASAVNWVQVNGQATGNAPGISSQGSDTNIGLALASKGTGAISFATENFATQQMQILDTPSSTRWITITGSNGGNPTISTNAGAIAFTPAISPSTTQGIIGTTLADSANAGSIGEFQTASTQNTAATSTVSVNATNISLPAGDWDVWGTVTTVPAGSTTTSALQVGISTTTATLGTLATGVNNANGFIGSAVPAGVSANVNSPITRINISSTTPVYLVANTSFAASTMQVSGYIAARRRR